MKRIIPLMASIVFACALCGGVLIGCAGNQPKASELTEAQQENRAYMLQVNQVMAGFDALCTDFSEALASGETDQVEKDAQKATENLEALKSLEAPEVLADVHENYVAGAEKLVAALTDYLELSESDTDKASPAYQEKLAKIQSEYDEGIASMKAGDEAAAAKE